MAGDASGISVYGLTELRRQMRQFAPDLAKAMDDEIKGLLAPVVERARSMVPDSEPLGRWNDKVFRPGSRQSYSPYGKRWEYERLEWDSSAVRRGIRMTVGTSRRKRGSHYRGAYAVLNRDAAGAVYELMGSGISRVPMVGNVRSSSGISGKRLIWRAWDELGGSQRIRQRVVDTIRRYEAEVQQRLDRSGR